MARRDDNLQSRLDRDLAELKLPEFAKSYREVLDEAARKGSSMLDVLATLIGMEQAGVALLGVVFLPATPLLPPLKSTKS